MTPPSYFTVMIALLLAAWAVIMLSEPDILFPQRVRQRVASRTKRHPRAK